MLGDGQIAELRKYGIEASTVIRALLDAHLQLLEQSIEKNSEYHN
jgi:hypothetical protein